MSSGIKQINEKDSLIDNLQCEIKCKNNEINKKTHYVNILKTWDKPIIDLMITKFNKLIKNCDTLTNVLKSIQSISENLNKEYIIKFITRKKIL